MKKVILFIVRSILFISILLVSLFGINEILLPKYTLRNSQWPTTSTYKGFYKMKKDTVDVLFIGSSTVVNAFIPQEIYNEYGIRSYNLGSEQQSLFLSYYWLKEALRSQTPSVIVLDTRFLYNVHPEFPINTSEGLTRKCLDSMRFSSVKRDAVHEVCALDPGQSELSYYLTNLRYHDRWSSLTAADFDTSYAEAPLKGYGPIMGLGPESYEPFTEQDPDAWMEYPEMMMEYLQKITDLCREEGIRLVLVSLPGNEMDDAANNVHKAFAKENNIDYYNLCSRQYYEEIGAVLPEENAVGHENVRGAVKTSRFIGRLLRDVYHVPSVKDDQYEQTKGFYEEVKKSAEQTLITDPADYLRKLDTDRFTVFICGKGSLHSLPDTISKALKDLGTEEIFTASANDAYFAMIHAGDVQEKTGEKLEVNGSFGSPKTSYTLQCDDSCTLTVNAKHHAGGTGLQVIVYDMNLGKVIDDTVIQPGEVIR
ncbi:MAG: hypothetical protein IJJ29_03105 [Solobacterium sp.]|nr:hypothetical protein [Solobacterium sp.]